MRFVKQAIRGDKNSANIGNKTDGAPKGYIDTLACMNPDLLTYTARRFQQALTRIRAKQ